MIFISSVMPIDIFIINILNLVYNISELVSYLIISDPLTNGWYRVVEEKIMNKFGFSLKHCAGC